MNMVHKVAAEPYVESLLSFIEHTLGQGQLYEVGRRSMAVRGIKLHAHSLVRREVLVG